MSAYQKRKRGERDAREPVTVKCAHCGKEFVQHRRDNIYCSQRCGRLAYQQRAKAARAARQPVILKCAYCGKKFARRAPNQIYCSRRCKSAGYYRDNRAKLQEWHLRYYYENREELLAWKRKVRAATKEVTT